MRYETLIDELSGDTFKLVNGYIERTFKDGKVIADSAYPIAYPKYMRATSDGDVLRQSLLNDEIEYCAFLQENRREQIYPTRICRCCNKEFSFGVGRSNKVIFDDTKVLQDEVPFTVRMALREYLCPGCLVSKMLKGIKAP